jgi:Uncharacterized conserved protein (DUF2190)
MANVMRWRYGDTNPVLASVASTTIIEIGDLVYQVSGMAQPGTVLADLGTKAANQEAFHDAFLGVAMQASPDGSTAPIRVATTGVFEFTTTSATFELGDLVGIEENAAGDELLSQTVVKVATANLAVGRCVKRFSSASTKVLVDVESTLVHGGPQVMA